MGTYTPKLNLYKPAFGETGWDDEVNDGFDNLDVAAGSVVNVKADPYNAVGDGVANDTAAILAACLAGAGGEVYFPEGHYKLTTGTSIPTTDNTIYRGAGQQSSFIQCENAYAFQAPTSGRMDRVVIQDFGIYLRPGATSGGAIKVVSGAVDGGHSQWTISRVYANGVDTAATPLVWVDGWIGSWIDECVFQLAGAENLLVTDTFWSNHYTISRTAILSAKGTATGGIKIVGGGAAKIRDCEIESNLGYGIWLQGTNNSIIESCWFEDNDNHGILAVDCLQAKIVYNDYHGGASGDPGAKHVVLTEADGNARNHHMIMGNNFQDPADSGICLDIGTNVKQTAVLFNRGLNYGSAGENITDNGTMTTVFGNDSVSLTTYDLVKFGPAATLRAQSTTAPAASGGDPGNAVLLGSDNTNTNYFMVGSRGFPIFRTGSTTDILGEDELQLKSFSFYWDETAGQIKARVRNNSGAYSTVTFDASGHIADVTDAHAVGSITDAVSGKNGGLESVSAVGATGSTETISLTAGNVVTFTVDANCTFTMPSGLTSGKGISFTAILTDSGGPRTITFTGVKWTGGANPTVMSGAGAIDIFSFFTIDGGTTWYGFPGGTGMAT